jgi:hypothetical protein
MAFIRGELLQLLEANPTPSPWRRRARTPPRARLEMARRKTSATASRESQWRDPRAHPILQAKTGARRRIRSRGGSRIRSSMLIRGTNKTRAVSTPAA